MEKLEGKGNSSGVADGKTNVRLSCYVTCTEVEKTSLAGGKGAENVEFVRPPGSPLARQLH